MYYYGKRIEKNIKKAIHYYSLAANQNNKAYAQMILGQIYLKDCNIKEAIHYYSLAAEQNDINSLNNLGVIYMNSNYHMRDVDKAIYYYKKLSDLGYPKASFLLGIIYQKFVKIKIFKKQFIIIKLLPKKDMI